MIKRPVMGGTIFFFFGLISAYCKQVWFIPILCVIVLWQLRTNQIPKRILYLSIWIICLLAGFMRMSIHLKMVNEQLKDYRQSRTITGAVIAKEEKKTQFYYFIRQKDCLVLVISKQQDIPLRATVVVTGSPTLFKNEMNDGNFNERSYYEGLNCIYKIEKSRIRIVQRPSIQLHEKLYQFRLNVTDQIQKAISDEEEGVLAAMITGEKSKLDSQVKDSYNGAGISHLLAISGTHLSILILGCYEFLRKRKVSYVKSVLLSGIFLFCFSIMSGLSVSTLRAAIMMILFLVSQIFGSDYDGYVGLSIAGLILLLFQPSSFLSISFQYSFLASYGALSAGKLLRIWFRKIHPLLSVIFMSSWITFLCFPLNLYHSYVFSSYQVLINGLVLPLAGILLGVGVTGSLICMICFPVGKVLLLPCEWILKYYLWIAKNVPKLPAGRIVFGKPKLWLVISTMMLSVLFVYHLQNRPLREWKSSRKQGERKSKKLERIEVFFLCGICMCFVLLCKSRTGERDRVTMLDVGQGDGIYFYSKGSHIMLDGGSTSKKEIGKYILNPYFNFHQIRQIDAWIISHYDQDHCNGLIEVMESGMKIQTIILSGNGEKNAAYRKIIKMSKQRRIPILFVYPEENFQIGTLTFSVLNGIGVEKDYDCNEKSLILTVNGPNGFTGFFGGDMSQRNETIILNHYEAMHLNVLKLNHHGSDGSNQFDFLKWCNPSVSIVSAGEDNRYHHPGKETIERLKKCKIPWFLTSETGQIDIYMRDYSMSFMRK